MSGERDRDGEPASSGEPDGWTEGDIDAAFAEIVARYGRTAPDIGPWPVVEDLDEPTPDAENRMREGRSASSGPASGGASPERPGRPGPTPSRGTAPNPPASPPTDLPPTDLPPTARPRIEGAGAAPSDGSSDASGARGRHREPDGPGGPDGPDGTSAEPWRPPTVDHPVRHLPDEVEADDDRFVPPEPLPIAPGDFGTSLAWVCVLGGPLVLIIAALAWRSIPGELVLAAVVAFIGGFVTLVAHLPGERPDDPDDGAVV